MPPLGFGPNRAIRCFVPRQGRLIRLSGVASRKLNLLWSWTGRDGMGRGKRQPLVGPGACLGSSG
ncbi:hypothetical protein MPL3365_190024 [Mesorhizobium plurifarium]|uniref:Uncharacterized protein n=1 Tax=Mesorhizobium plurifarium TaxID=69974 RepID=A0A090GTR3_MESPL|nr:hypothetical protein MPL3365_190024 [Mesorhizobium plurifarium]